MGAADYRMMSEATGQRIAAALEALSGFGAYLTTADVVDDLTSTSTTAPLSANMGKTLNDNLNSIFRYDNTVNGNSLPSAFIDTGITLTYIGSSAGYWPITYALAVTFTVTGTKAFQICAAGGATSLQILARAANNSDAWSPWKNVTLTALE